MTVFARVVEAGSFARAADRLDLSTSAVSRHVAALEQHLGVRLLHRTTRRLALTEAGEAYPARCVQLLSDLEHSVHVSGPVDADSGDFLVALATGGRGIAMEPDFIVGPELASGRLVRILADWRGRTTGIYAVYPSRRHLPAKVRLFVDFLADRFRGQPSWN